MAKPIKKEEKSFFEKYNLKWVIVITVWTFILSAVFSVVADKLVSSLNILVAFIILIFFILIGVLFDIIGIAVTAAVEKPFHAMAANKVKEAKMAIKLVRNSSVVSNFCNDVIGDISGILSGATAATIVFKLVQEFGLRDGTLLSIIVTAFTASLTVGGKGIGKSLATYHNEGIIYNVARVITKLEILFNTEFFPVKKKNIKNRLEK